MGANLTHSEVQEGPNIVAIASVLTAACCCVYQAALHRTTFPSQASLKARPGASGDVEVGPAHQGMAEAAGQHRPANVRTCAPPPVRPPMPLIRAVDTIAPATGPTKGPQDGVLVDAYFYSFYMDRSQLPAQLQVSSPNGGHPTLHPQLCVSPADKASVSTLCRSPTSAFQLHELTSHQQRQESPSSVADFHEFEL